MTKSIQIMDRKDITHSELMIHFTQLIENTFRSLANDMADAMLAIEVANIGDNCALTNASELHSQIAYNLDHILTKHCKEIVQEILHTTA
ncbi:hypothetical protein N9N97_01015 [Rickettsiaceae bacterium]|nr:hypothetical protein [Rickettsiaceae bacterium]